MTVPKLRVHLSVLCSGMLGWSLCKPGCSSPGGFLAGPASRPAKRDGRLEQEEALALGSCQCHLAATIHPVATVIATRSVAQRASFVMTLQGQ